ncbi:MAG TPA: PEP/pyruvate-binding domain-containing protein, partial [Desulfobacterales bacterium]|nr:PEP/pyruvate-binding domain-containing protein [Desulfobacterales bacterium]
MDAHANHMTGREDFDLSFKVFHELMARKVTDILLVSSPYEAFIMEEEGRLAERIIHEYRGLNLSRPPMLTWASTSQEALEILRRKKFDLVITMPLVDETDAHVLGRTIKQSFPDLPVFLLVHKTGQHLLDPKAADRESIDRVYVWQGNTDLLLALIKNLEDRMNVAHDTERAKVRVIIVAEDSPVHYSSLLPVLYKEIVTQTQAAMEESVNDEHRIFRMRARPKILVAETYEEALELYRRYQPYLLGVLSDVRFPRGGALDDSAGFALLSMIRAENPDLPLLNLSSEEANRAKASQIPAVFVNKNSPALGTEIHNFFMQYLGFGDFLFRLPDGREIARASNLRSMEKLLPGIPDESVEYHAQRNHFSSWFMARSEVMLASKLKPVRVTDFDSTHELKHYLVRCIHERRKGIQRGIITEMAGDRFDPDADFIKIGRGSLGGKARGLAFASLLLKEHPELQRKYAGIDLRVPKTVAISTEGFDAFVTDNHLREFATREMADADIAAAFLNARFPEWLERQLELFIEHTSCPLAVRSSSMLEDAQFQPFAGIYHTYMLPNNHPDRARRLNRLIMAVKLVYASTYYESPRSFAKSTFHRIEEEKMAVAIQHLAGGKWDDYYMPTLAGVVQSYNFYPIAHMKPEEGIAHVALGLGKMVVEGGTSLRFSPRYPQFMPQFSTVDDILKNSQRFFYALRLKDFPESLGAGDDPTLSRLAVDDFPGCPAVRTLASTYYPQEHRIRDGLQSGGLPVVTFAGILKYREFPLPEILSDLLEIGRRGMGCPVEIEFAVNLPTGSRPVFELLQIRPMAVARQKLNVEIDRMDRERAICYSSMALGNGQTNDIEDIVFVDPDAFDVTRTIEIAAEVGRLNKQIANGNRRYLLIGPGRWGSADRWLGIPVKWTDISAVKAVVETATEALKVDPSQGSHF